MYCTAKLLYLNFTILYYEMQFEQNKMRCNICTVSDNNYHISCQVMFTFSLKFYFKKFKKKKSHSTIKTKGHSDTGWGLSIQNNSNYCTCSLSMCRYKF